ncbi:branched-chain amino acid transport system II carrier protein [Caldisericum sp.]|jgi:LIVCS family branched-chain amino acid:cation transporter|uniref:branched-chain amino acid transport system II carrier protein n=1 Tax=Caldisericum sp. TaxID=2499687 RepID=UPI003D0BD37F
MFSNNKSSYISLAPLTLMVLSFAVFSAHYGVGDLIFPVFLGKITGANWVLGAIGYGLINSGGVFLAYLAISRHNKSLFGLSEMILGKKFAYFFTSLGMLIISVIFILPRVASATYSMGFALFFPQVPLWAFLIIYFGINYYLVYSRSQVINKLGMYLAPALLIFILIIFVIGVLHPLATPTIPGSPTALTDGVLNGYNTMNALGAALLGLWILNELQLRGVKDAEQKSRTVLVVGAIVAVFLFFTSTVEVYLGATSGAAFPNAPIGILTVDIVNGLLGTWGIVIFAIILALACLTTSAGMLSTAGDVFEEMSKGKVKFLKYNQVMIWGTIIGYFIGLFGLQLVINFAVPWLLLIYPALIVIIIITQVKNFEKVKLAAQAGVIVAIFFSIGDWLNGLGVTPNPFTTMNSMLPGGNIGFAWFIPTITVIVIVQIISMVFKRMVVIK